MTLLPLFPPKKYSNNSDREKKVEEWVEKRSNTT